MPGRVMAEIIDAARGAPASGLLLDLFLVPRGVRERRHVKTVETGLLGTVDPALIEGEALQAATYEMLLHLGRYFMAQQVAPVAGFALDVVPVRFTITDPGGSYRLSIMVGQASILLQVNAAPAGAS